MKIHTYISIISLLFPSLSFACEATWPIVHPFKNNGGYAFLQKAKYSGGWIYHPGEDWNVPTPPGGSCDADKGLTVVAVAAGTVVYNNPRRWGGIVIKHQQGKQAWFSQYGHIQNSKVKVGDQVSCKQAIAEIGDTATKCAHLHFEIRSLLHPMPENGSYWLYGKQGLGSKSQTKRWYHNPRSFLEAKMKPTPK
ncbi:MAG: M23 family metallopeptidase [Methylococcales bacterium]|jgi:murein DD-endopeptidase MepM/ murein hydrolase activator NlpD|nr:M23 family metallopeptidase [Methylococcales bacterium]MBT7444755.1 M23 family metallopeptidase [Methylococcales bacterium]